MIQSRLTVTGIGARFAFFLCTSMCVFYLPILIIKEKASLLKWCFYILAIISLIMILLILVMKTRNISVDRDKITYTNWLTRKARVYYFKDLDGYITIIKPIGKAYQERESAILVQGDKRIGEISHWYYSNYDELIGGLKDLKYLGEKDNEEFKSIKDSFNEVFK